MLVFKKNYVFNKWDVIYLLLMCMLVFKKNCVFNKWDVIGLLFMIEIVNDVVVVLIGIFGEKS